MTVLDEPRTAEQTPESQDLARLQAMLHDPDLAGFRTEIQQAIDKLVASTFVADLAA